MTTLSPKPPLVVIAGPTAVGKSRIAVPIARALDTEIITADSRQVYRGMDIAVDKPSMEERGGVRHWLLDVVAPHERFNVGEYRRLALPLLSRLHGEGRLPLIVGGTGLYIRALIRGLWEAPPADWAYREALMELARREGPAGLHRRLAAIDPDLAATLHPNDAVKIIRGLEAFRASGRPLSAVHREHARTEEAFAVLYIVLHRSRLALYRRIEARVDALLARGLVEETRRLLDAGYGRELPAMNGLGYRQIAAYLAGEYDRAEAVRRLKRDTRHYAKRQLTWFRKEPGTVWIEVGEHESEEQVATRVLALIHHFLATRPSFTHRHQNPMLSVSA